MTFIELLLILLLLTAVSIILMLLMNNVENKVFYILGSIFSICILLACGFIIIRSSQSTDKINEKNEKIVQEANKLTVEPKTLAKGKVISVQNENFGGNVNNNLILKMNNGNIVNLDLGKLNAKKKVITTKSSGKIKLNGFMVGTNLLGMSGFSGSSNTIQKTTDNQPASNYLINTPYSGLKIDPHTFSDLKKNDRIAIVQPIYKANDKKLKELKKIDESNYDDINSKLEKQSQKISKEGTSNGIIIKDN